MSRFSFSVTIAVLAVWFPADLAARPLPAQDTLVTLKKAPEKQRREKINNATGTKEQPTPQPLQPPHPATIRSIYLIDVREAVSQLDNALDRALNGKEIEFEVANLDAQQRTASVIAAALGEGEAQVAQALLSYSKWPQSCRPAAAAAAKSASPLALKEACKQAAAGHRKVLELTLEQDLALPVSVDPAPILSRHGNRAAVASAEDVLFALEAVDSSFDPILGDARAPLAIISARASVNAFAASPEAFQVPQTTAAFRTCIERFERALLSPEARRISLASARKELARASSLLYSYKLVAAESASLNLLDSSKTALR